jgi:hypothetical protein
LLRGGRVAVKGVRRGAQGGQSVRWNDEFKWSKSKQKQAKASKSKQKKAKASKSKQMAP